MSDSAEHIDKPEPRGQALLAFLAICAIYLALPRNLIVGPIWLLPTLIVVLLVPTVVSHRVGRHSLNRVLGIIINGITTLANRIGDSARACAAFTPGDAVTATALRRTTLADECDRLRAVVLATGRRRTDLTPQAKQIRQYKLSFSADADP